MPCKAIQGKYARWPHHADPLLPSILLATLFSTILFSCLMNLDFLAFSELKHLWIPLVYGLRR